MNIKQKIASAIATGMLMSSVLLPVSAYADNTVNITDNGSNSTNNATIIKVKKSKVKQKNVTIVGTNVNTTQNTGGNQANGNTNGGENNITTGNATTNTTVTVGGSSNTN